MFVLVAHALSLICFFPHSFRCCCVILIVFFFFTTSSPRCPAATLLLQAARRPTLTLGSCVLYRHTSAWGAVPVDIRNRAVRLTTDRLSSPIRPVLYFTRPLYCTLPLFYYTCMCVLLYSNSQPSCCGLFTTERRRFRTLDISSRFLFLFVYVAVIVVDTCRCVLVLA